MALQYRNNMNAYDLLLACDHADCDQVVSGSMITRDLVASMYPPRGWELSHNGKTFTLIGEPIEAGIPGEEVDVFCPNHTTPNPDTFIPEEQSASTNEGADDGS